MKTPAFGVEGHLIYTASGKYMFRVYKENFEFTDYDLLHSDLCVTITDEDATFYSDEKGNRLDHNPETLGHQPQEQSIAVYDSKELAESGYTIKDCDPIDCKGPIYWVLKPELRKLQNE